MTAAESCEEMLEIIRGLVADWTTASKVLIDRSLWRSMGSFIVVQSLSHVWLWDSMDWSIPGFPIFHYLPEFAQVHGHWVHDANNLILCLPLLLLPSIFPCIRVLSQHHGFSAGSSKSHNLVHVLSTSWLSSWLSCSYDAGSYRRHHTEGRINVTKIVTQGT